MKKFFKPYFIIPAALLLFLIIIFTGWYVMPKKTMDIAVLNKTVPATEIDRYNDTASDYRKHIGFFWLIHQKRFENPETSRLYDYKKDYYGVMLDEDSNKTEKILSSKETIPDLLYLTDSYGDESSIDKKLQGLTNGDMSVASLTHANGGTVIGESDILTNTPDGVRNELSQLFGVNFGTWKGRYIYEMADLTDVPVWAPELYSKQYGHIWNFKGSGILLVSSAGRIIVLEEGVHFNSKNMLRVSVNDEYKKEFGKLSANFYNWFDIDTAQYDTDVIAQFKLDLNTEGLEKFKEISQQAVFPAVIRKNADDAPTYYFSGDFDDFVTKSKYGNFLFSDVFYRAISYENNGSIGNFFWKFYTPMMNKILKNTYKTVKDADDEISTDNNTEVSKLASNSFMVFENGKWKDLPLNGFNINSVEPGNENAGSSSNFTFYQKLVEELVNINASVVRTGELLPSEFYRAVYENNKTNGDNQIFIIQTIKAPADLSEYYSKESKEKFTKYIKNSVEAMHGKGSLTVNGDEIKYRADVSPYILSYDLYLPFDSENLSDVIANAEASYGGEYFSSSDSPVNSVVAYYADELMKFEKETYKYTTPIGLVGNTDLLSGAVWSAEAPAAFNLSEITVNSTAENKVYVSYAALNSDSNLLDYASPLIESAGGETTPFAAYINQIKKLQNGMPVMINSTGVPSANNAFDRNTSFNGLNEKEQGNAIVEMLSQIKNEGCLGGMVSDLNDDWSKSTNDMAPFTVPFKNNDLWKNMIDGAQNTGVLSLEPKVNEDIALMLKDSGLMQQMVVKYDSSYVYLNLSFLNEVNYDTHQLIVGIDTYQRNNGEYLFDPAYFANSLSGMEFEIKFESKVSASLYAAESYSRPNGRFASVESYSGAFNMIAPLEYGTFDTSSTNFYQSGPNINIRIPWNLLNVTDPVNKLVVNDDRPWDQITALNPAATQSTNGFIFYVLVAEKGTKDTTYIFPESKESTGYKTFTWDLTGEVQYDMREKESFNIVKKYFAAGK